MDRSPLILLLTLGPIRRMDYVFNNLTLVLKVIFKALGSITDAVCSELSLCVCAHTAGLKHMFMKQCISPKPPQIYGDKLGQQITADITFSIRGKGKI